MTTCYRRLLLDMFQAAVNAAARREVVAGAERGDGVPGVVTRLLL